MNTVSAKTSGLSTSASIRRAVTCSPLVGTALGCSDKSAAVTIQETCGRRPPSTSRRKASANCSPSERVRSGPDFDSLTQERQRSYNSEWREQERKAGKNDMVLSPKLSYS